MRFLYFNGKISEYEQINFRELYIDNSLQLTQNMWFGFGGIPLFVQNIELLTTQAEILNIPLPAYIKDNNELFRQIKRMLNKNRCYKSGFIRLKLISDGNMTHTIAICIPLTDQTLPFPEKGSLIRISDLKKITHNSLNRYAFYNKIIWDASLLKLKGTTFDNALILNDKGMACECAYGNIFFIKENMVITPSLLTGCYEDTFRDLIKKIVHITGKIFVEKENIVEEDIYQMDEIFIAGENIGIQWVLGIENKRYLHEYSLHINEQLNYRLKQKVY